MVCMMRNFKRFGMGVVAAILFGLAMSSQAAIYLGQDSNGYDWTFMEKRLVNKGRGIKESWAFQERQNEKRKILYSFNCRNQTITPMAVYDYKVAQGRADRLVYQWQNPTPGLSAQRIRYNTFAWQMFHIACP